MAKNKKAGTNGYYNPADFLNQAPSWAGGAPDIEYKDPGVKIPVGNDAPSWYNAAPDISSGKNAPKVTGNVETNTGATSESNQSELPQDYLAQRRPWTDPTGNIATDMDGTAAPQDTPPTGKQVANTNTAVANAQPGDWIIRSNGTKIMLKQADIDWAKSKLTPVKTEEPKQSSTPVTSTPVTSTATPDIKDEAQMTMMTGGRFTGDEKAREAYAPRSAVLQPETPKQVNNAAKDIAKARVGDWIVRSNGTKVMLSQADIDWAKGKIKDADPNGTAKKRTNTVKQGQADAKAAMEAAGYKNR